MSEEQAPAQAPVAGRAPAVTGRKIRLGVGLPAYGLALDAGHAGMWLSFGYALRHNEEHFEVPAMFGMASKNPVAEARNSIIGSALDADADWVLQVDADTYHGALEDAGFDILQMLKDGDRAGAAVIGAAVQRRLPDGKAGGRTVVSLGSDGEMYYMPEDNYRGRVVECARIGGAFFAVNLNWIRKHWPYPPWFEHRVDPASAYKTVGEDWNFCDGVRERGGKILLDGRFFPLHVMSPARL